MRREWVLESQALCRSNFGLFDKYCRLFCNIEGSIIAKAGKDDKVHSEAAVLANICHEYIEFGTEAFKNNTLQALFMSTDNV